MKGNRQDIQELTRIEAYLLSEKAGHPSHMHDYFWIQAEAIVRQRAAIVDVAVKAAGKKPAKATKSIKAKPAAEPKPVLAKKKPAAKAKKTSTSQPPQSEKPAATPAPKPKTISPVAKKPTTKTGKTAPKSE